MGVEMSPPRLEIAPGCFADPGGNVVPIAGERAVNEAWEDYAAMARRIGEDSNLLFDRSFNEQLARKHDRWRKLFLMGERA